MQTFPISDAIHHSRDDHGQTGLECHTYFEIAAILSSARDGMLVSPEQIERICRTAEEKLAHALLGDADFPERRRTESITNRGLRLRSFCYVGNARDHHRKSNS